MILLCSHTKGNYVFQELSRNLLSLVIDGPEADSVWATYQDDPEEIALIEKEMDEAEMEEQYLS